MELYYDLHLHSCLSPCGDDDMTPANIAGMAYIKGLNVIALTDHNTARNCPALLHQAAQYGITAIPGMELTTQEEVHVLCLFAELADALRFDEYVYEHLIKVLNKPEYFGEQVLRDLNDEPCGKEPYLLINATDISFDQVYDLTEQFHGIMIPAHVDKSSTSIMSNLGFVPPDSKFHCFELASPKTLHKIREQNPYLENCNVIFDSDAHYLQHMHEAIYSIDVEENTPAGVLAALMRQR